MTDLWEDIRAAIATKANADVAAVRQGTKSRPERRGELPAVFVYLPTMQTVERPQAHLEQFTLTFPCELVVGRPHGQQSADEAASSMMRALQVAWRSGIQLGLSSSGVWTSWISSAEPTLDEEEQFLGYAFTVSVGVLETLSSARTV